MSGPSPDAARRTRGASWLLALDASTPRCAVAVGRVDVETGTHALACSDDAEDGSDQASARLVARMERALAGAGIGPQALAAVACGRGPGTFTGTRVAVASAKGLAYGLGRPVVPVSTLAAVAASAGHDGTVLALLDARRGEVYGGRFHCTPRGEHGLPRIHVEGEERVTSLGSLLEALGPWPEDARVVGPGVVPHGAALPPVLARSAQPLPGPTALGLWTAAVAAWSEGRTLHPSALGVVYLRASYAEIGVHPPKRPFIKSPFV